jgi:hypothetical protein
MRDETQTLTVTPSDTAPLGGVVMDPLRVQGRFLYSGNRNISFAELPTGPSEATKSMTMGPRSR